MLKAEQRCRTFLTEASYDTAAAGEILAVAG